MTYDENTSWLDLLAQGKVPSRVRPLLHAMARTTRRARRQCGCTQPTYDAAWVGLRSQGARNCHPYKNVNIPSHRPSNRDSSGLAVPGSPRTCVGAPARASASTSFFQACAAAINAS